MDSLPINRWILANLNKSNQVPSWLGQKKRMAHIPCQGRSFHSGSQPQVAPAQGPPHRTACHPRAAQIQLTSSEGSRGMGSWSFQPNVGQRWGAICAPDLPVGWTETPRTCITVLPLCPMMLLPSFQRGSSLKTCPEHPNHLSICFRRTWPTTIHLGLVLESSQWSRIWESHHKPPGRHWGPSWWQMEHGVPWPKVTMCWVVKGNNTSMGRNAGEIYQVLRTMRETFTIRTVGLDEYYQESLIC